MCFDIEEYPKVCRNYEYKMDHYSGQLHNYNILLNAQVVDPPVQSGDSPTQIPVSQVAQPIEVPSDPELKLWCQYP